MAPAPITNFDVTYSLDNGSSYKNLSYSKFSSPLTATTVATTYPKIVKLNSTQSLMVWIAATFVNAVIVTESNGLVTLGRTLQVTTTASDRVSVTRMSDTQAIIAFRNASTFLEAMTLNITGTEIVAGASLVVNAVATTDIDVRSMSTTQAIVAYSGTSTYLQACTLDVSGTALTNGAVLSVNAVASTYIVITSLSSTQAVVAYRGTTSYLQTCTLNVSGTTLTNGTVYSVNAVATTYISIVTMSSTRVMISYIGTSSYAQIAVVDITGGTSLILFYAVNSVNAAASAYTGLAMLTESTAVVTYVPTGTTFLNSSVVIIGASSSTFGSLVALNAIVTTNNWLAMLSSTKVLCAHLSTATPFLQLRIIDVSGTTVSSITDSTTAGTTVTLADGIGDVSIGNYAFGTGIAGNAKVTNISGNAITLDIPHTAYVSGQIRFNQLPNETVTDALAGFPLRLRFITNIPNIVGIPSLYFYTNYTTASAAAVYPLDTISLVVDGLKPGSDVVIYPAGTTTIRDSVDSVNSYTYVYETPESIDIGVFKSGYIPYYIRNLVLTTSNSSIPVAQVIDRNYI
jgi:hypothetical protein